jgi:hypothetical protein
VDDLTRAVRMRLDQKPDEIVAPGQTLRAMAYRLVVWAEDHGEELRLAKELAALRPNHPEFAALVVERRATHPGP